MKLAALSATYAAQRRAAPNDDILSLLVTMEFMGEPLTDAEVIGMCLLLISGGHETTSKLIANRVRPGGKAAGRLDAFLARLEHAPLAWISERAAYGELAERGLSVFDKPQKAYAAIRAQWAPVLAALG